MAIQQFSVGQEADIVNALATAPDGDIIELLPGGVYVFTAPITIKGNLTLRGQANWNISPNTGVRSEEVMVSASESIGNSMIGLAGDNIRIEGLSFTVHAGMDFWDAVIVAAMGSPRHNIVFSRNIVTNMPGKFFYAHSGAGNPCKGYVFHDNLIDTMSGSGKSFLDLAIATDIQITNNRFLHHSGYKFVQLDSVQNVRVEGNHFEDVLESAVQTATVYDPSLPVRGVRFLGNTFKDCNTSADAGEGGLRLRDNNLSDVGIMGNTFDGCTHGLIFHGTDALPDGAVLVRGNRFLGNTIAVKNESTSVADVRENIWNDPAGPAGAVTDTGTGLAAMGASQAIELAGGAGCGVMFTPWRM